MYIIHTCIYPDAPVAGGITRVACYTCVPSLLESAPAHNSVRTSHCRKSKSKPARERDYTTSVIRYNTCRCA